MNYHLSGDFVECCDCFTVCPCWVSDKPDEDHCSGLYVWSFGAGSQIGDVNVAGMHVAAATFHAVRAKGQVMFFIDTGNLTGTAAETCEHRLYAAFSDNLDTPDKAGSTALSGLVRLLGVNLGYRAARISSTFANNSFNVSVSVGEQEIAVAGGKDRIFGGNGTAMKMQQTALGKTLGIGANDVIVQEMGVLSLDVAALPGGALNFRGRSGMRTKFKYEHTVSAVAARKMKKMRKAG